MQMAFHASCGSLIYDCNMKTLGYSGTQHIISFYSISCNKRALRHTIITVTLHSQKVLHVAVSFKCGVTPWNMGALAQFWMGPFFYPPYMQPLLVGA